MKKILFGLLFVSMSAFGADATLNVTGTPTEGLTLTCATDLAMGVYSYANGATDAEDNGLERIGSGESPGTRGACTIAGSAGLTVDITHDATATLTSNASNVTVTLRTEDDATTDDTTIATATLDGAGNGSFSVDGTIAASDAGTDMATESDVEHTGSAQITVTYQ